MPPEIVRRLRPICLALPEVYEEPAWIGLRWRIRRRTVAHVYVPDPARAPVYATHTVGGEPPTVLTFRVPLDDLDGLIASGPAFFRAPWGPNVAAAVLNDDTDWTELAELLTDSYREMAPRFLAARV